MTRSTWCWSGLLVRAVTCTERWGYSGEVRRRSEPALGAIAGEARRLPPTWWPENTTPRLADQPVTEVTSYCSKQYKCEGISQSCPIKPVHAPALEDGLPTTV